MKKSKRHTVVALIAVLFALTVAACGDESDGGGDSASSKGGEGSSLEGKTLGFVTFSNDLYQLAQSEWFKRLAEEQGAEVRVVDGKLDPAVQQKAMDDLIAAGMDGIVFQPVDSKAGVPPIKQAQGADIPVVVIGTPDESSPAPSVVFNESELVGEAGRKAGEWVKENKPNEKAKVVIFDIPAVEICRKNRMDSFENGVREVVGDANVEVVFRDLVEHERSKSRAKMEDIIQSGNEFNIFTACGAEGFVGGFQALDRAGRTSATDKVPNDVYGFSIDGTPSELEFLFDANKSLVETISLAPKDNAQAELDTLTRMLNGELDATADDVTVAPGIAVSPECKAGNTLLKEQYGLAKGFEEIDCSKFE